MWKKQLSIVTVLITSMTALVACSPHSPITASNNKSSSPSNGASSSRSGSSNGNTSAAAGSGANNSTSSTGTPSRNSPGKAGTFTVSQRKNLSFSGSPVVTSASTRHASAPDFLNGSVGFIGLNDRVLMTTNGGGSWQQVGQFQGDVESVTFINQKEGYVATRSGNQSNPNQTNVNYTWSLLRTTDGGVSWKMVWQASKAEPVPNYMSTNSNVQMFGHSGYAILGHYLLKTPDGGQTWTSVPVQGTVVAAYASTAQGLWVLSSEASMADSNRTGKAAVLLLHSTDGGKSFHPVLRTPPVRLWESKIAFTNANNGFFLTKSLDTWQTTLYRTTDGGAHWTMTTPSTYEGRILQGNPVFASASAVYIPMDPGAAPFPGTVTKLNLTTGAVTTLSQPVGWRDARLSQSYGQTLYAAASLAQTGMAIYKSTDGGKTWTQVYPIGQPNISVRFVTPEIGFGIGMNETKGYIYKTKDGGKSWTTLQSMQNVFPTAIAFVNSQTGYVSAYKAHTLFGSPTGLSLYVTHDGGRTWSTINPIQVPQDLAKQLAQQTSLTASSAGLSLSLNAVNPVYVASSSDGKAWRIEATLPAQDGVAATAFLSPNDAWIATSSSGTPQKSTPPVYKSTIYHWSQGAASFQPLWSLPTGWAVLGMTREDANHAYIFATKSLYDMSMGAALFVTQNDGKSWTEYQLAGASAPLPLNTYPSGAVIDLSFVNSEDGYMLTGNGLLKTTNGGSSWKYVTPQ